MKYLLKLYSPFIVYGSQAQRQQPTMHIKKASRCVLLVFLISTLVLVGDWHLGQIMWVGTAFNSSLSVDFYHYNWWIKIMSKKPYSKSCRPFFAEIFSATFFLICKMYLFSTSTQLKKQKLTRTQVKSWDTMRDEELA